MAGYRDATDTDDSRKEEGREGVGIMGQESVSSLRKTLFF